MVLLFITCAVLKPPFISKLILRALTDKRLKDGARQEEWGSSSPHAFALGSLLRPVCQGYPGLSLDLLFATLPMVGILPLCIPLSIHYTNPPSMSLSQRQRCGVRVRAAARFEECDWVAFMFAKISGCCPHAATVVYPFTAQWQTNKKTTQIIKSLWSI